VIRRALTIVIVLMLLVPALAEAKNALSKRTGNRVPSAQLAATGSGAMTVVGRMSVYGTIPEWGSVVILDRAGDAEAHLAGQPQQFSRGRVRVVRVRQAAGLLFVKGSNLTVTVLGVDLSFSVAGNGRAKLLGTGVYRLNSDPEKSWARTWFAVAPPSSASARRRSAERCTRCSQAAVPQH
jgi:hypothetical protein